MIFTNIHPAENHTFGIENFEINSTDVLKMLQLQWTASSILKEEVTVFAR